MHPIQRETWFLQRSHWFRVAPSSISGAGVGVFTQVDLPAGVRVFEYKGMRVRADTHRDHTYCYDIDGGFCLNARRRGGKGRTRRWVARFVNDAINTPFSNNLAWDVVYRKSADNRHTRVFMRTTCAVPAGAELFIPYGAQYWAERKCVFMMPGTSRGTDGADDVNDEASGEEDGVHGAVEAAR